MSLVRIDPATFGGLKGKVVVITGGANGIGRATVEHLNDLGASVVFGDLNCPAGEALASTSPRILFVPTDVTSYLSLLNLFRTAYALHSRLDHAISSAGIMEIGTLFDGDLDDEASIEKPPSTAVLDVSLLGSYYFLRVAVYYLRKSKRDWGVEQRDASLVLVSSTAGFHSYNGLCGYSASKHGIMGLLRSTKNFLEPAEGIRVNAVQPNAVRTSLAAPIIELIGDKMKEFSLSEPGDLARAFLYLLSQPVNGQVLYTVGDRAYETEQRYEDLKPQLLGREVFDELIHNGRLVDGSAAYTENRS